MLIPRPRINLIFYHGVLAPHCQLASTYGLCSPRAWLRGGMCQLTWASHVTVVPAWFDPGEASVGSAPAARAESSFGRIQLHYTTPFDDLRLR